MEEGNEWSVGSNDGGDSTVSCYGHSFGELHHLSNSELLTATALSNINEPGNGVFRTVDYGPIGIMLVQNMSRPLEPAAAPYYVYSYIGVDPIQAGKSDLTGVDSFEMSLDNVNNSPWELTLYVQADGVTYLSDYQVVPNQTTPIDLKQCSFNLSLLEGRDIRCRVPGLRRAQPAGW